MCSDLADDVQLLSSDIMVQEGDTIMRLRVVLYTVIMELMLLIVAIGCEKTGTVVSKYTTNVPSTQSSRMTDQITLAKKYKFNVTTSYEVVNDEYIDETHACSHVKISYPRFEQRYQQVNDAIILYLKEYISYCFGDDFKNLDFEMKYKITYSSAQFISIVFTGSSNQEDSAHPNNECITLNVDMIMGEMLHLADFIYVDDQFVRAFASEWRQNAGTYLVDYLDLSDKQSLLDQLHNADSFSSEMMSYIDREGIGIVYMGPHAVGDYVTIEIPWRDIE
jgi:hypothetical protein